MLNVSIPRRYARALIDVAGAKADAVLTQLSALVELFEQSSELKDVATNPAYTRNQRLQVIEAVIRSATGLEPELANALRLLVERNRLVFLPDILRLYRDFADVKAGRVRGKVSSAVALSGESLQQIERSLEKLTQRNVVLETRVDPTLLGGVSAQVGSLVFDGSLRSQLQEMQRQLIQK
jgi:F-type H+-transporting ATPase subunit delta